METIFKVKKSERGKRLDAFLYGKMGILSHRQIKLAIDKKRVLVNGINVFISSWNLKPSDRVTLLQELGGSGAVELSRYHYVDVLYEDTDILAVNKHPFVDYDSYVAQINAYLKRTHGKNYYPYVGQVHRLDKETSGILLFTKKKSANVLADQFRNRKVRKVYLAIVAGSLNRDHGIIRERLEKQHLKEGKKVRVAKAGEGKEAFTEYWTEERYPKATLLRIQIGTGRTHQIRVHMADLGYPILGDKLYGEADMSGIPFKRQALHAHRIEFNHPITGKLMKLTAPIPKDLADLIDRLRTAV
ncbi:MAG: RluA family pseudouridine synthase [Deltaproteobacteria bacterium]|nr:RluA family pseudouridine synthase [Deltaproteobacteria bacterium]